MTSKPFRFGVMCFDAASRVAWTELARRAEALGYSTFVMADHYLNPLTPVAGLVAAADATNSIRIGCQVFDNDFRHPAMLAKEGATVDLLTDGRFDFGIGAGWSKEEYDQVGIPFDAPGVRVARMEEGLRVIKALWADGPVHHAGRFYTINGLEGTPKPAQRPHPPVLIGGGGKRVLQFAAREADIVSIIPKARCGGGLDWTGTSAELLASQVGWIRDAAADRIGRLELEVIAHAVVVTGDRRAAAERIAAHHPYGRDADGLTAEQVLATPDYLIGSARRIAEALIAQREQLSISRITVYQNDLDAFAEVIPHLAGR
jgi:probable F420-dependent oxidoreductase